MAIELPRLIVYEPPCRYLRCYSVPIGVVVGPPARPPNFEWRIKFCYPTKRGVVDISFSSQLPQVLLPRSITDIRSPLSALDPSNPGQRLSCTVCKKRATQWLLTCMCDNRASPCFGLCGVPLGLPSMISRPCILAKV